MILMQHIFNIIVLRYLNLQDAILIGNSKFSNGSDLRYLNNSFQDSSMHFGFNEEVLKDLTASTQSLEKLSLEKLSFNFDFVRTIVQNSQTLRVLYLSCCKGLTLDSIELIVTKCDKLIEVNLDYTNLCHGALSFLCNNLTFKIEKLSLAHLKITDENIQGIYTCYRILCNLYKMFYF